MQILRTLLFAVAVLCGTATATAQTYPKFTGLVVDAANVLPPATEAELTAKLEALQKDTKRQLVVATIPDLEGRELPEYGVGLGRAWGVGLNAVNTGAILFIAPNEPKGHRGPRIEVGYGLEPVLTDALTSQIVREQMLPRLKQSGDIAGAMTAGTDALIAQLRAAPEEQQARVAAAAAAFDKTHRRAGARRSGGGGIPFGLVFFGLIVGFVILSSMRRGRGGTRYRDGIAPVVLWGSGLGNGLGGGWGGGSSGGFGGFGGGSSGGGGSDGSWGGGGFTGGGGGSFGGGGASGDW